MAGEFSIARASIDQALEAATADSAMSEDVMETALLCTLLEHMAKSRSHKDLASVVAFQLESCGVDEFVITRGS